MPCTFGVVLNNKGAALENLNKQMLDMIKGHHFPVTHDI